ncbi:hypothetical protein [Phenylobacterium sp.]|uniref:hypothetical protein n=1 Tax=Phenylobacterium sp. TaxID=1871053 RepID=UPI0027223B02|nr:hypothetical protein [Phenylobacterium sp.]MDO8378550.1 hypothetical protein [Phenylobacterium sp.]
MTTFVPPELTGLWRREVITTPKGYRDETTAVLWLQARSWYADLRVKADRPNRPGATGFADYTDAELIGLAAVQGFAGELTATGNVCLWRRDLDYQPPSHSPDEATFAVNGEVMIEDGIHSDYQEIWRREPGSASPLVSYRKAGGGGLLVIAGNYFTEILDRDTPLPKGESLAAIVTEALAAGRREAAVAALSMRICHGEMVGAGRRVTLSSYPWLEGQDIGGVDPLAWTLIDCDVPAPAPS